MGSFISGSVFFALTSIFSITYCYELPLMIRMPMAVWFDSLTNFATGMLGNENPRALSDTGSAPTDKSLTDNIWKVSTNIFGYVATMLGSLTRRTTPKRPMVEMGPGSIKSEIVKYPENYFVNRLKTLLKIKKKEEERNKPLNKPE